MLKGVTRLDDAKRAVNAGITAISVSNHGGNNLDGTPATIRMLPGIARAVGDQVEMLSTAASAAAAAWPRHSRWARRRS